MRHAVLVILLVPIRVARHVLRLLSVLLLLSAVVEHLLEELELCGGGADEKEGEGEDGEEDSRHVCAKCYIIDCLVCSVVLISELA